MDGARYRRIDDGSSAGGTTTTTIIGAVERLQKPGGAIQWRRMIGSTAIVSYSGDQLVGGITQAAGAGTVRHQFSDRLGSVQVIGLVNGSSVTVQERLDGGADGQWRTPDPPFGQAGSSHTPRGFTGHEHLEGHDTIHMNGRLYWPTGGRMVQADPIITDIYNPQNWNPYSYVLNNPLNLTDPSGYSFISKYWRTIAAIVITIYAPYAAPWIGLTSTQAVIAGGFVAGAVQTNSLRGGIYGAFSAGMFNKIGTVFQGMSATAGTAGTVGRTGLTAGQFTAKIVAHGMAGGVMSSLQGGKFGHGFASAGFSEAASPIVASRGGPISQGTAAAVIGGTASAMTGGKFANGAVTAAFSYAFNELMHYERTDSGEMTVRSPGESIDTEPLVSAVVTSLDAGENAAMHWAGMANETGNPFYDFLGGLASLWTPDTAFATATTLIPIGGGSSIGVRAGKEIRFGKNLRIAVFGNRTGHKYGELPHYHRRGIDPRTGGVIDGQGIGRHRPWEPKSTDRYFWDRF